MAERAQKLDLSAETPEKAARGNPAKPNPCQEMDDLTHPEFSRLNRLSSDFLR
jgi:hypothetical protein